MHWDIIKAALNGWAGVPRIKYKIVIGLGNPGEKYARTRHNVGFWCVERLARKFAIVFTDKRRYMIAGEGKMAGHHVAIAKPNTFVNRSGQAVASLLGLYRALPSDLVVLYDDMDLPVGHLRVRSRGSAGGHNGVKSVIEALGTREFIRVRVGIGRPLSGEGQVDHVLGTMSVDDLAKVEEAVDRAARAVVCILTDGVDAAMEQFN